AVYEKTSWCGMPWSRMYSPVRRCQKSELSDRLEIPTAQPNRPNTAVNTAPRPRPEPSRGGAAVGGAGRRSGGRVAALVSVGVAVMPPACACSERPGDLDEGGSEDDDEDGREDAEDEWEQHLHRRLLRLLLSPQPPPDPHLVGLGAQQAGDRDTE